MCVSSGGAFVSTLKHNHCTYIFPCDEQSCASLEEFSREPYNHNCCTDIISVRDNCVSSGKLLRELCSHTRYTDIIPVENNHVTLQRNFCVNFLSAITTVISFLWEIVMWFCKEFFFVKSWSAILTLKTVFKSQHRAATTRMNLASTRTAH